MRLDKAHRFSWVLIFVSVFWTLCVAAQPSRAADEASAKETLTEELPPGEVDVSESLKDKWLFIADFDAFFTISDPKNGDTVEGGNVNGLFAPVYMFNDSTFFIMMYDGHYYKKLEFYSDDIGGREREQFQSHTIQPMVRFDFGEKSRYSITPSVFHTATYNRDNDTSGWSDGLYNYRDYGAGIDFDMRAAFGDDGTLSFGMQYYSREYPNYASLLSITGLDLNGQQNVEKNEKDYHGIITKAGYSWIKPFGLSWEAEYSMLYKSLDDKKIVDSNGVLTSDEQEDYLHSLDVNLSYMFDVDGGLKLGLDLNGTINDSNQNYWNEQIVGLFSSQKYTNDYYDYFSYRIRPSISYTFALYPLTPSISYSYYKIRYDERRAEHANGDYKKDRQYEYEQNLALGLKYELTDNWSILGEWEQVMRRSNNDDESTYEYEYTINYFTLGVAFKY
ncbi:MAG: hypothetical protein JRF37_04720 [Deltaproteobacteria bacterium]|nr:hypothetical protein [Deltaproteobacteria bacterium]